MYASSWATPTSESTTADVRPAVTKIFGQSPQGIVRYASASSVAYSTATEAASVAVNTPARIPPRMMMGAPSGGNAASPARTSPEGVTATRSPVGSLYLAYRKMTRPLASPTTNAGISEARNRSRMDRLATVPRMIIVIDGGMRIPVPDAAATIAADHAHAQPAGQPADEHRHKAHQPLRRAGAVQDLAGEDEHRDREERERVDAMEDRLRRGRQRQAVRGGLADADRAERSHDRRAEQDQHADAEEADGEAHVAASLREAAAFARLLSRLVRSLRSLTRHHR